MKKFIILMLFTLCGCSAESSTVQNLPATIKNEQTAKKFENSIDKNCTSEHLLEMYEKFTELGIKAANLSTERASIKFEKITTSKEEIESILASEFGSEFLKNACAFEGLIFSIDDTNNNYLGSYQITFNSKENASEADILLKNLGRDHFETKKVATVFDWTLDNNTILINYNSHALVSPSYENNVSEFSK